MQSGVQETLPEKITWGATEKPQIEKEVDWYWAVGLVVVSLIIISILFGNYIFAILVAIATFALFIQSFKPPEEINVVVYERGVIINDSLHLFEDLDSFWVDDYDPENPQLLLKSKKILTPMIILPIDEKVVDLDDLADYLLEFIDEEELVEPVSKRIMEWFGF